MAEITLTRHLCALFPNVGDRELEFAATTVAEVVAELERRAPGIAFYLCDELGRLRQHVNIFVDDEMLHDRRTLADRLKPDSRVFIAQALSGG